MYSPNCVVRGDCVEWLDKVSPESVDLVYIDPPFFTQRNFKDFDDRWSSMGDYISWVKQRVVKLHSVLKPTGSIMLHCDWHASHYLRVMLDEVFGYKNFVNEIVWCYNMVGRTNRHYARKHDVIFYYFKTKEHVCKPETRPFIEKHLKRYNKIDNQGRRYARVKRKKDAKYYNYYLKDSGVMEDWWVLPSVRGKEYLDYPTQKTEALLTRIIKCTTNPGDIVLDSFCGSGTTAAVAHKLGRRFIVGDKSPKAIEVTTKRLKDLGAKFTINNYRHR